MGYDLALGNIMPSNLFFSGMKNQMVQIRRFSTYMNTSAAALRAFESNAQSNLKHKACYSEYKRIHTSLDVPESAIENVNMSIFYLNSIRSV